VAGARAAYERAISSPDAEAGAASALFLGLLLQGQGDVAGARAAYEWAISSGEPEAAPAAALSLGLLLQEQGDVAGARAALKRAVEFEHGEVSPGRGQRWQGSRAGRSACSARAAFQSGAREAVPASLPARRLALPAYARAARAGGRANRRGPRRRASRGGRIGHQRPHVVTTFSTTSRGGRIGHQRPHVVTTFSTTLKGTASRLATLGPSGCP